MKIFIKYFQETNATSSSKPSLMWDDLYSEMPDSGLIVKRWTLDTAPTLSLEIMFRHCRWRLSPGGRTALSIWPQSGEADLSQLQLSLLTDTGGSNDSNDSNGSNDSNDTSTWPCPRGHGDLRWCRDTCYSGHVCDQDSQEEDTQTGHVYGVDSNILSTMLEDSVALQVSASNTYTNDCRLYRYLFL